MHHQHGHIAQETNQDRRVAARRFLENEVWPLVSADQRGTRLTRTEEDDLLGYGPDSGIVDIEPA